MSLCDECDQPAPKEKKRYDGCLTLRSALGAADGPVVGCSFFESKEKVEPPKQLDRTIRSWRELAIDAMALLKQERQLRCKDFEDDDQIDLGELEHELFEEIINHP